MRRMALVVGLASVFGCSEDPTAVRQVALPRESVARGTQNSVAALLGKVERVETRDEELLAIARAAPGFAGFATADGGRIVVSATKQADRELVLRTAVAFLTPRLGTQLEREALAFATVREVDFDFVQLYDAYQALRVVGSDPGFTSSDIDEMRNRIVIGGRDSAAVSRIQSVAAKVSISPELFSVEIRPPAYVSLTNQDQIRPIPAGTQIMTPSGGICTMGPVLHTSTANGVDSSETFFATNAHCTDQFGYVDSAQFGQSLATSLVGVEVYDPPLFDNSSNSQCDSGRLCRYSDAALVRVNAGILRQFGQIARTRSSSDLTLKSNYVIQGETPYYFVGLAMLYKTGRTTGTSFGTSVQSCVRVRQYFSNGVDTGRDMLCQDQAQVLSGPGDSGSPVFSSLNTQTTNVTLHGMLWGRGYSVFPSSGTVYMTFSPINLVYAELNGHFGWTRYLTSLR